jgi:hypothetical protein
VAAYVSLDRGATWQRFMNGLPTVPVHDLKIHPRDHELIAATHGHAINIIDIAPLQQLKSTMVASNEPMLFAPAPGLEYSDRTFEGQDTGHQYFSAPSPAFGADIAFYSPTPVQGGRIVITDAKGDTVNSLPVPAGTGLQHVSWNLRPRAVQAPRSALSPSERRDSIMTERRIDVVADSLKKAGKDSTLVNTAVRQLRGQGQQGLNGRGGGGGGNFGGRAGGNRGFNERPGEGAAGRGQGAGPGGGPNEDLQALLVSFRNAGVRPLPNGNRGFGGGGGGGGFAGGSMVEPGDYNVTLVIGDKKMTQKIKVVRGSGTGTPGTLPGMADDNQ